MKLVLHIGAEKTGTTSVQGWLQHNIEALKNHKIWFCQSMGRMNNFGLPVLGRTSPVNQDLYHSIGINSEADLKAFLQEGPGKFAAEVAEAAAAGCETFVVSSEHLQSRLPTQPEVDVIAGLLTPLFDQIDIHFFVRPQIDAIMSFVSTKAYGGTRIIAENLEEQTSAYSGLYDYHGCWLRWTTAFPDAKMNVVSYNKTKNSVAYFSQVLGLEPSATETPKRANASIDIYSLAIGNVVRATSDPRERRERIALALARLPFKDKIRAPQDLAQRIQSHFEDGNAKMVAACPSIDPTDLTPDWNKYSTDGNLDRLPQLLDYSEHMRGLVDELLEEGRAERVLRFIAEARLARRNNNLERAFKLLANARAQLPEKLTLPVSKRAEKQIGVLDTDLEQARKQAETADKSDGKTAE